MKRRRKDLDIEEQQTFLKLKKEEKFVSDCLDPREFCRKGTTKYNKNLLKQRDVKLEESNNKCLILLLASHRHILLVKRMICVWIYLG